MRHLKSGRKLNRTASHRKAMLSNLAASVLLHERVTTTTAKAKEVRGLVERLITYGKKGKELHAIRTAAKTIKDKDLLMKIFEDIAPSYADRNGGYTRVLKLGERKGDNAEMSIIELVGRNGDEPRKKGKKATKKVKKSPVAKKKEVVESATEKTSEETPVKEEK